MRFGPALESGGAPVLCEMPVHYTGLSYKKVPGSGVGNDEVF